MPKNCTKEKLRPPTGQSFSEIFSLKEKPYKYSSFVFR
ncbi:hypothetical protein DU19_0094 [Chlamydia muridarum]|nr:hypothetical protein DU17_0094 [Chlamydia muridarum]KDU81080.1 hypothetical protein DU18_0095 [Chlamydia muridarum]KDU82098.1 hypothetical protein DU19_0094 [Chlamydia muridarum]KDU83032.1 hypothetical protein DU20_0094 [Chlamydia muridarum]KDU84623.1 hypothetical protein DU21_0094 [Chlamydia muridarum]